ncbi:MAG TPA: oxidoreductase [Spirochaetia bacterium]|nr:oxidoreductase [Spirochaetia bacterium]
MNKLKIAVIGIGNMGGPHCRDIKTLPRCELTAVCDTNREKADKAAAEFGCQAYYDHRSLIAKAGINAVIISTPHYDHTVISIDAFKAGLHVLSEKPVAVHVNDAQKMIRAFKNAQKKKPDIQFAAMFQQRTFEHWKRIKSMVSGGELGKIVRATWIITDWFRSQRYYDSGGWRATWSGEGGGVLINQCPHNIDLFQWFFGVPDKIRAFAGIGKYHNIEVEDEVNAYFEYKNGMTGQFITTTAELPGTNRLEIAGENGKLVYEDCKLTFYKNPESMFAYCRKTEDSFGRMKPEKNETIFEPAAGGAHKKVISAFTDAVLEGSPLIAHGSEGINSVAMANAMLLSSFKNKTVDLPLDGDEYEILLGKLTAKSKFKKNTVKADSIDMSKSF